MISHIHFFIYHRKAIIHYIKYKVLMKKNFQKIFKKLKIYQEYRQFYILNEVFECILSIDAAGLDHSNIKIKILCIFILHSATQY